MLNAYKTIGVAAFAVIFSVMISNIALAGVGLSPASVEFYNMTRGGYAERYLTISNPGEEMTEVRVSAEGGISEFLLFYPSIFNLTGNAYQIVMINASPPVDMPNGIYEGTVFVVSRPLFEGAAQGSQLIVASGVSARTFIEVTDVETKEYTVETAMIYETEECRDIQINLAIRNTGNVRATPKANIMITSMDGSVTLQNYDFTGDVMLPTTLKSYFLRVPYRIEQFKCIPPGDYKVTINFYLDGRQTESRYLGLTISERGTLSVSGNLIELYSQPNITVGDTLRIDGLFKNTGQLPVKSKLKVEAYQGDRLIDTIEGEEIEVGMGAVENLTAYYKPSTAGKNMLRGRVVFESKLSNIKEIEVDVSYPITFFIIIVIVAIAVIIGAIFFLKRKTVKRPRRRR